MTQQLLLHLTHFFPPISITMSQFEVLTNLVASITVENEGSPLIAVNVDGDILSSSIISTKF